MKRIDQCGICDHASFETLWRLPKLPLTERFGAYDPKAELAFDQELLLCARCGHVQLGWQLSPSLLYADSAYSFRTGESKSAVSGTAFFVDFLDRVAPGRSFASLLDVGGNDLYLARQLGSRARERCVVDPICASLDGREIDGIKVFGRMIEDVNLSADIAKPDLVACRHALEHVSRPANVIRLLFEECHPDCLYIFEIPCFENLSEGLRFDAVFHQHYHYYDLVTFRQLLEQTGGEYVAHDYNRQGSCGGAMLVAFKKSRVGVAKTTVPVADRIRKIKSRIDQYRLQMSVMRDLLQSLPKPVYGYGASLMLATLGYQLGTDFSGLECILDDDKQKDGMTYQNVPVTVRHPDQAKPPRNSSFLVTSLENMRPIHRRIQEFAPRRILMPFIS